MGEENVLGTEQQTADQQDAFLTGWDEEGDPGTVEETQSTKQGEPGSVGQDSAAGDGAKQAEPGGVEKKDAEQGGNQAAEPGSETGTEAKEPTWIVKHMGAERTLGPKDVTPELLQKGMDYDRIREKYDEAKPVMAMFAEFARNAGMSVPDYVKHIRAEAKKASGMSDADAKRAVDLEDREAAVSEKEAAQQEESSEKAQSEAKIQADLAEFSKAFPEIYEQAKRDPKAIPQAVWEGVRSGLSLTAAYSRYAVAKATEDAQMAREGAAADSANQRNKQRSTGSMQSAGKDKKTSDPFLDGFDG